MRVVKFVLNSAAFKDQILKGPNTVALLNGVVGPDGVSEESPSRARARIYGDMDDEAQSGSLTRRIGGWRV